MATNDTYDPAIAEADQRAERAKASLRSRLATLEERIGEVRKQVDVPAHIQRHPWPAVGIAFALGLLAGGRGARISVGSSAERSLGGAALAALGALGLRVVRELAISQLSRAARQWWTEHGGASDDDAYFDRDRDDHVIDATIEPFAR